MAGVSCWSMIVWLKIHWKSIECLLNVYAGWSYVFESYDDQQPSVNVIEKADYYI